MGPPLVQKLCKMYLNSLKEIDDSRWASVEHRYRYYFLAVQITLCLIENWPGTEIFEVLTYSLPLFNHSALVTDVHNTFMFYVVVCFKTYLVCSLVVTLVTYVYNPFMFGLLVCSNIALMGKYEPFWANNHDSRLHRVLCIVAPCVQQSDNKN